MLKVLRLHAIWAIVIDLRPYRVRLCRPLALYIFILITETNENKIYLNVLCMVFYNIYAFLYYIIIDYLSLLHACYEVFL